MGCYNKEVFRRSLVDRIDLRGYSPVIDVGKLKEVGNLEDRLGCIVGG